MLDRNTTSGAMSTGVSKTLKELKCLESPKYVILIRLDLCGTCSSSGGRKLCDLFEGMEVYLYILSARALASLSFII